MITKKNEEDITPISVSPWPFCSDTEIIGAVLEIKPLIRSLEKFAATTSSNF